MLALIQMPEAKLLRLPEEWEHYRAPEPADVAALNPAADIFDRKS